MPFHSIPAARAAPQRCGAFGPTTAFMTLGDWESRLGVRLDSLEAASPVELAEIHRKLLARDSKLGLAALKVCERRRLASALRLHGDGRLPSIRRRSPAVDYVN
jgi:hypothetical protein